MNSDEISKTILFRADGNENTGLGHLYRLFALVEIFKDHYQCVFLTRSSSSQGVVPKNYRVVGIPDEIDIHDEPKWLASHFDAKISIIFADGYQFTSDYQKNIKKLGFHLCYVDDLTKEHMYADIVINHSPYVTKDNFEKEDYTHLALGLSYSVLRPGFLDIAKRERSISKIDTAFVCFGGADFYDLTYKAAKALVKQSGIKKIHIVLGGAYQHKSIYELHKEKPEVVELHSNLNETELIGVMESCNFGIAPSSTICYELCCVKMPILSGYFIDNQELIYRGFVNENVIYPGGDFKDYTVQDFSNEIVRIVEDSEIRHNEFIKNQFSLFDGKQKERYLSLIQTI